MDSNLAELLDGPPQKERAAEAGTSNGSGTATVYKNCLEQHTTDSGRGLGNLNCALAHAKAGRPVFPCRDWAEIVGGVVKGRKSPLVSWTKDATTDEAQIRRWWRKWPNALPAVPTGRASGLAVLDLDVKDGKNGLAALRDLGLDPDTLSPCIAHTMRGGRHLYFRWQDGLGISAGKIAPGVDVRGEGGYVIAPGAVSEAGVYSWADPAPADLPEWPASLPINSPASPRDDLAALLGDDDPGLWADYAEAKRVRDWEHDRIRSALRAITDASDRDTWLQIGMALHHVSGGSDEGFGFWAEWSRQCPAKYKERGQRQTWRSFGRRRGGVTIASLYKIAKDYGWDPAAPLPGSDEALDALLGASTNNLPAETKPEKIGLIRAKNGDLKPTLHNAVLMLRKVNREQGYRIRLNDMSGREEWRGGPIGDGELGAFRVAMEQAGMHNAGADLTAGALRMVAQKDRYHPIRDWLDGIRHDGTPRIDTWLTRYLGAEDSPLHRAEGRAFLIAMVARVMQPGCKHDHVLVLSGDQGARKSTVCSILGGEWTGDNMPSIREGAREAGLWLPGHWLVELAELAPSRKADAEDLKSFLSRQADDIRAPYARRAEIVQRQCVFVGTTNEEAFLRDATGGRRFWPVTCGETIDTDALRLDREQLFAEAVAAFRAGEAWHLSPEMERLAAVEQEGAREEDTWEGLIRIALHDLAGHSVSTADLLWRTLNISSDRQTPANSQRVARIMRKLGWAQRRSGNVRAWWRQ